MSNKNYNNQLTKPRLKSKKQALLEGERLETSKYLQEEKESNKRHISTYYGWNEFKRLIKGRWNCMFFDEIDEEITKENVNKLLGNYHRIKRIAGSYTPKVTASYSLIPRTDTGETSDSTFDSVALKSKAIQQMKAIEKALNSLSAEAKRRLYFKYISTEFKYDYEIYNSQNISKDTYYRELGKAQIEFAEAYENGKLLFFYSKKSD